MIVVTGTLAYDYIMNFPGLYKDHIIPDQIHQINLSFIVNKFAKRRGGTAGNVSYSLNLLGTDHILLSAAGRDFDDYKKYFENRGISTKHILLSQDEYTASGFGMTDKNNNQIWGYFYGASELSDTLQLDSLKDQIELVLVGPCGAKGVMNMVRQCVSKKIPYLFDPGFVLTQVTDKELEYGVSNAAYLIGNDYEIESMKKRIKDFDAITKSKTVITTLGEKGAAVYEKGKKIHIKASLVQKVVDPTGAGDAWRGGFLAGFARGYDIVTCFQIGSVAASFAVEKYGSQEHTFTQKQFQDRYRQTFNSLVKL